MTLNLPIALDAMGGDKAPESVIKGARRVLREYPDATFHFFGREAVIAPLIHRYRALARVSQITHTDDVIAMDAKPSVALRQGRDPRCAWRSTRWRAGNAARWSPPATPAR
ncbi:MAG: hypothetical protein WDN72_08860 [Alphaproteobacteria bacterium]